jgi:hypothetical protein
MMHAALPAQINQPGSEGYGTCSNCRAHACRIHGDIVAGQTYFMCADCLARAQLITAVTTPTPTGGGTAQPPAADPPVDPGLRQVLNHPRRQWFRAVAPRVTDNATSLVTTVNNEAMAAALSDLVSGLGNATSLLDRALNRWRFADPVNPRRALGLMEIDDDSSDQRVEDETLGMEVIALAAFTLQRESQSWPARSLDDVGTQIDLAT